MKIGMRIKAARVSRAMQIEAQSGQLDTGAMVAGCCAEVTAGRSGMEMRATPRIMRLDVSPGKIAATRTTKSPAGSEMVARWRPPGTVATCCHGVVVLLSGMEASRYSIA